MAQSQTPFKDWLCVTSGKTGYIYIYSSTERLFRCITTLHCVYTRQMLQAEIETWFTFRLTGILPQSYRHSLGKWRNFLRIYFYIYAISYWSAQFMRIYIYIYIPAWTIGRSGERWSGISVLPARYDDDDDDDIYIYIYINRNTINR